VSLNEAIPPMIAKKVAVNTEAKLAILDGNKGVIKLSKLMMTKTNTDIKISENPMYCLFVME
jgi:hypothetical protein